MNTRLLVPVVASMLLISGAAFAKGDFPAPQPHDGQGLVQAEAALAPYNHCIALQKQFDEAVRTHGNAGQIRKAVELRAAAGKQCGGNEFQAGIHKMTQALYDIGVQPKR